MIGIITAEAVITIRDFALGKYSRNYVGSSFLHDGTTYCLDSKSIDKVLVMFLVV